MGFVYDGGRKHCEKRKLTFVIRVIKGGPSDLGTNILQKY